MLTKIDITKILGDFWRSFDNAQTRKTSKRALVLFFVAPIAMGLFQYFALHADLGPQSSIIIGLSSITSGFLASAFALLLILQDRHSEKHSNTSKPRLLSDRVESTLREAMATVMYGFIIGLCISILTTITFTTSNLGSPLLANLGSAFVVGLFFHYLLVMAMIVKRIYALSTL